MTTTWEKVQVKLSPFKLTNKKGNHWFCNNPFRAGSDSLAFKLVIHTDGEHGAFKDHVSGDKGSLYELAEKLGVEVPSHAKDGTKRKYASLQEYAEAHFAPEQAFIDAGWQYGKHTGRPCLMWQVNGTTRYRFLDGEKPYFTWPGGHPALYGVEQAIQVAKDKGLDKLVLVNGEPSVIVGQHYGIPAFCVAGGEGNFAQQHAKDLHKLWQGKVLVAFDDDQTGAHASVTASGLLRTEGFIVAISRIEAWLHADVADVCGLYGEEALSTLLSWIEKDEKKVVEQATAAPDLNTLMGLLRKTSRAELEEKQVYDQMSRMVNERNRREASGRLRMASSVASGARAKLAEAADNPKETTGLLTYLTEFDKAQGGFKPFLYVFLGAPNMGKSQVAVSLAASFLKQGPGLIVPTETTTEEWFRRLVAADTGISARRIELGQLSADERRRVDASMARYESMDIGWLEDRSPTPEMIRATFAEGKEKYGWEWIIIDSISNMSAPGTSDLYQTIAHIASELLAIYQDFDIPVVGTSQIGRDVADRPKKSLEPRLTDGFGGGKIEQLANVVWGVYDHSYYVKQGMAEDNFAKYPDDTITLIQLKGKTGRSRPRVIVGVTDGAGITDVKLRRVYANLPELAGMKAKETARQEKEGALLDMTTMA